MAEPAPVTAFRFVAMGRSPIRQPTAPPFSQEGVQSRLAARHFAPCLRISLRDVPGGVTGNGMGKLRQRVHLAFFNRRDALWPLWVRVLLIIAILAFMVGLLLLGGSEYGGV